VEGEAEEEGMDAFDQRAAEEEEEEALVVDSGGDG